MIKLGATTFWEDFNINWLPNASRIDELYWSRDKIVSLKYTKRGATL
ncbi:MAG: hypothetical protein WKG06_42120 [Segetibacter sp.]